VSSDFTILRAVQVVLLTYKPTVDCWTQSKCGGRLTTRSAHSSRSSSTKLERCFCDGRWRFKTEAYNTI